MLPVIEKAQLNGKLPEHDFLGKASIALTIIGCSPGKLSIIPDQCTVSLDRVEYLETIDDALGEIQDILEELSRQDEQFKGEVRVRRVKETSYTGYFEKVKSMPAWFLEPENPFVQQSLAALREIGQNPSFGKWDFATDASYVTGVKGITALAILLWRKNTPILRKIRHRSRCLSRLAGNAAIVAKIAG